MEWETFLLFVGVYILLIGIMVRHWVVSRRMIAIHKTTHDVATTNQDILESIKLLNAYILEKIAKKEK